MERTKVKKGRKHIYISFSTTGIGNDKDWQFIDFLETLGYKEVRTITKSYLWTYVKKNYFK